ncbi:MAG: hypothetical protein GXX96_01955 [Planctomycetaceae bacterium]|nr:hypothetical protein [Planctomycetaceae bacterium]
MRVLDYLIRRYGETEVARRPARRVALPTAVVNTRAMVVHHHLWSGVVAGVKSRSQAQQRIANVLHRMEDSFGSAEEDGTDESHSINPFDEPEDYPFPTRHRWGRTVFWAFRLGCGRLKAVRRSLAHSPFLPEYAVKYLLEGPGLTAAEHVQAIKMLACCASRYVFESAVEALADRLESAGCDPVCKALADLLRRPVVQEFYYPKTVKTAQMRLRERLASEAPDQRRRAIGVLGLLGDLQDISLLADLAAVGDVDGAFPNETTALLAAMDQISRRPNL